MTPELSDDDEARARLEQQEFDMRQADIANGERIDDAGFETVRGDSQMNHAVLDSDVDESTSHRTGPAQAARNADNELPA